MVVGSQIPQVEQIGFLAVRKIYPHLHRKKLITKFLQLEDHCIEVVIKNKIGKDIANPQRRSRGAQLASVNDTTGHHPGAGYRLFGGGRKNKLMHIWARVKAWHTVQRLGARQIDLQDVWLSLEDQMMLEIEVYT